MHVSNYFYGTWNDKQITVNDTYPMDVFGGELFRDIWPSDNTQLSRHQVTLSYPSIR